MAFKKLKLAFASAVILSPYDPKYRLHVATDASKYGIGGVVYYRDDTGSASRLRS